MVEDRQPSKRGVVAPEFMIRAWASTPTDGAPKPSGGVDVRLVQRGPRRLSRNRRGARYQACEPPQCGQPTEVETTAWKMKPHPHEYIA
jgi:hypothetical protein